MAKESKTRFIKLLFPQQRWIRFRSLFEDAFSLLHISNAQVGICNLHCKEKRKGTLHEDEYPLKYKAFKVVKIRLKN